MEMCLSLEMCSDNRLSNPCRKSAGIHAVNSARTIDSTLTMFTVALTLSYKMDETSAAAALSLCALAYYNYLHIKIQTKKRPKKRRWWMTSVHRNRSRLTMEKQISELVTEPSGGKMKFTRMSDVDFEYLLNKISPAISKRDTQLREAVPARTRLAITLRFLTSGDNFKRLNFLFKVSPQLISKIIPEVCEALNLVLKDEIKIPSSAEEWFQIERGFTEKFPHTIGTIDGKHIVIRPSQSDSEYSNIVLLSIIDNNYNFIAADIAGTGRMSDGGIFSNCLLWKKITTNALNFPPPKPLRGSRVEVPYVLLGDDAFALSTHIMKPYIGNYEMDSAKGIFNQKLFGARVVVENTLGILASKFRIFCSPLSLCSDKVSTITMSCILLHNFLRKSNTSSQIYTPPGSFDVYDDNGELLQAGLWRNKIENTCAIRDLPHTPRRSELNAKKNREEFTNYFINKARK